MHNYTHNIHNTKMTSSDYNKPFNLFILHMVKHIKARLNNMYALPWARLEGKCMDLFKSRVHM